jgi:Divergent InlB B-repeat domain
VGCAPAAGLTPCGYGGGGGPGSPVCAAGGSACFGAFGGGASDVRQGGSALANRVLVAGGGGGAGGPSSGFCTAVDSCQTPVGGGDGGAGGALAAGRGADGANYVVLNPPPGQLPGGGCGGGGGTQAAGGSGAGDGNATCHGPTGNTSGGFLGLGGQGGDAAQGAGSGAGGGGGYFGGGGGSGGGSTSSGSPMGGNNGGGGGGGGGGSSFAAPAATNVTMTAGGQLGDGQVTVTYGVAPVTHVLTVSESGPGSVASSPAGIDCGTTCTHAYDQDTLVTLTATPASGTTFAGWSGGACSGTGTCMLTISADQTVTATFNAASGGPSGGGSGGGGSGFGGGGGSSGGAGSSGLAVQLVGSPAPITGGVVLKLRCSGLAGHSCHTAERLTSKRKKLVVVGSTSATIPAGHTQTIIITLNGPGHGLLTRFHKLPVTLTISLIANGKTTIVATRHLTIKQKKKKH